jgi:phosphoserine phosphatase RsbU/P
MASALVTALARSALRTTTTMPVEMATPASTLRLAGRRLHQDVGASHFVACALAVVEPPGLHHAGPLLRLANAAQVPVLLVRDGEAAELQPPGYRLPLGVQPDSAYKDVEVELRPGDVVVFSSDGLVEAPAREQGTAGPYLPAPEQTGALFGFDRLRLAAAHWTASTTSAEAVAEGMWSDLTAWCGDESHHDDTTLLVLRVPS